MFPMRYLLPLLALLLVGCAKTYQFNIPVHNATNSPLSVGLVKNGPMEQGWESPAQIAVATPDNAERRWAKLVPPGQTVVIGPLKGSFAKEQFPFLRVYRGNLAIADLLAIGRDSMDRVDVPVQSGTEPITIINDNGRLKAQTGPAQR